MHRNAELKRFTNAGRFHTCSNAAPERRIKQHHIDRCIENIRSELLEVDYDCVRRERHANLLTHAPHSVQAKHWVFQIIIANVFDLLPKPNRCLGGPHTVRIKTKPIAIERSRKRTIAFELVLRREYTALQLVRSEPVELLQCSGMFDELRYGANLTRLTCISKKQVRRKRHTLAQTTTEYLRNRHAPPLPKNIKTRKLDRGEHLRTIVVKRRRRVGDQKSQLLKPRRIVSNEIILERMKRRFRRLATD